MKKYMTSFGYGQKTGIDLPGEVNGLYPDKQWKEDEIGEKWYIGNTYHASIGQGFIASTALQVANSIAAIVNGGTLYEPHVVHHLYNKHTDERVDIAPRIIATDLADDDVIDIVQQGMRQTVTDGTATMLKNLPVEVAGKTGTAQFGTGEEVHSWFASYAPYKDPEMVMVIMVEGQTGSLSSTTVPVAHDVYEWYYGGKNGNILDYAVRAIEAPAEEIPLQTPILQDE
jgi:penicillin-binding protein 2